MGRSTFYPVGMRRNRWAVYKLAARIARARNAASWVRATLDREVRRIRRQVVEDLKGADLLPLPDDEELDCLAHELRKRK